MIQDGLFVFPTHKAKWGHNKEQLLKANETSLIARIPSIDQGQHKAVTIDFANGLVSTLYLCRGARVAYC